MRKAAAYSVTSNAGQIKSDHEKSGAALIKKKGDSNFICEI